MENERDHKIILDDLVEEFINYLEKPAIAKVLRVIDLLENFGHGLGMPHSKKITAAIYELRIRGRHEIRFLYCFQGKNIVLLHGFVKKSDKIPKKEIEVAIRRCEKLTNI
ncbi:MAG: type II toxin-antitoxin system RelE/ParE family toxin [Candidatus Paceibacterota bacterium]